MESLPSYSHHKLELLLLEGTFEIGCAPLEHAGTHPNFGVRQVSFHTTWMRWTLMETKKPSEVNFWMVSAPSTWFLCQFFSMNPQTFVSQIWGKGLGMEKKITTSTGGKGWSPGGRRSFTWACFPHNDTLVITGPKSCSKARSAHMVSGERLIFGSNKSWTFKMDLV